MALPRGLRGGSHTERYFLSLSLSLVVRWFCVKAINEKHDQRVGEVGFLPPFVSDSLTILEHIIEVKLRVSVHSRDISIVNQGSGNVISVIMQIQKLKPIKKQVEVKLHFTDAVKPP